MLIGYVSDEYYQALPGVMVEFEGNGQRPMVVQSAPSGAVYAEIPPGTYQVTLAKDGYGAKRVTATIQADHRHHFRLLSHTLYGYAWPKWIQSGGGGEGGGAGEFRGHSNEPYHISLWRYGKDKQLVHPIGWFDEHGPHPNRQTLPDGDFTQGGVSWNRYGSALVQAPQRSGLYYFHVETPSGAFLSFPWVVAPQTPQSRIAVIASTNTWNAYNSFGGRSNYINPTTLPRRPTVNARLDLSRYNGQVTSVWQFPDEDYAP